MNRKKVTGVILLVVGLIFLSIPLFAEWEQSRKVHALENALKLVHEQNGNIGQSKEMPFSREQLKNVMELEIPSINLKEKVLDETNEDNLRIALTQIKPDQIAGKGNFAVAGHRGYRGNRHFRKLPDVKPGDEVILRSRTKTFTYKVIEKRVIEPTELAVLQDAKGKQEITLITCTIDGRKRVAVKGQLQ